MAKRKPTLVAGRPGADPTLPDVTIILGGRERKLCYDFNAICVASEATGINLIRASVSAIEPTSLRALLWAALLRDEPKLTLEQVGAMIRPASIPGLHAAVRRAWFESGHEDGEDQGGGGSGEAKAQAK